MLNRQKKLCNKWFFVFSVSESASGSPGIKNETIITSTSTTSNNKDEVLVTAESTSTSNLDTVLLEFVEKGADNSTTAQLDAILSEFVKENGVSEKEIAEFFLVVEEAKVQNELKSTTTKRKVLTSKSLSQGQTWYIVSIFLKNQFSFWIGSYYSECLGLESVKMYDGLKFVQSYSIIL